MKTLYKLTSFNILLTFVFITLLSGFLHLKIIYDHAFMHESVVKEIVNQLNNSVPNIYFNDGEILINTSGEMYLLGKSDTSFKRVNENPFSNGYFSLKIDETKKIVLPYYISYNLDNAEVIISSPQILFFIISTYILLLVTTILVNISFALVFNYRLKKFQTLKISAQEYALSERTISYLISIMHHKLNTPLKILSTKTRVLIEAIIQSDIKGSVKEQSEWNYVQIDRALKTITEVSNKLKSYNELSQHEVNIYKLLTISKETIEILKDDDFDIAIDYKSKLFDINKKHISSHEIIQIFINQIKFSLSQLSDKIAIKVFNHDTHSVTILYTDNGNRIPLKLINMINEKLNIDDLNEMTDLEKDYFDILLNVNILTSIVGANIRLLTSDDNGNVFEIKIPTIKRISK